MILIKCQLGHEIRTKMTIRGTPFKKSRQFTEI